jgi:hypothetical protein
MPNKRSTSHSARYVAAVASKVVKAKAERDLDAEIEVLYDRIRDLVARLHQEPGVRVEIEDCERELRMLQELEAGLIWDRLTASRHLKPGSGRQLLAEIESRLADA